MPKRWRGVVLVGLLLVVLSAAWLVRRARREHVTLDFNNAELAEVVRAIERQTWKTILIQPGTTRRITIQARDIPLEKAFALVSQQAECEWAKILPIYRDGAALDALKARITSTSMNAGIWTNYPASGFQRPGFTLLDPSPANGELINYSIEKKEAARVASDLSRFGRFLVVLENGVAGTVSLKLENATPEQAAQTLASTVGRKTKPFYVLRPFFKDRMRGPSLPPPGMEMTALPDEVRQALQSGKPVQIRFEPKEGARLVTPEELTELPVPPPLDPAQEQKALQKRTVEEIRNSTPEQRIERLRQIHKRP